MDKSKKAFIKECENEYWDMVLDEFFDMMEE